MIENSEYRYVGKKNPLLKQQLIPWIFLFFLICSFELYEYSLTYTIVSLLLGIATFKLISIVLRDDDNIFLFTNEKLIHVTKGKTVEYSYSKFNELNFLKAPRFNSYCRLKCTTRSFDFEIHRNDEIPVKREDFVDFLFQRNEKLLIMEGSKWERYKYFRLDGVIRKVLVK
jgi:hypothetical protein